MERDVTNHASNDDDYLLSATHESGPNVSPRRVTKGETPNS